MTKGELSKIALTKIKDGKSRQETLEEMHTETQTSRAELAKILKYLPPLKTRERYKVLNAVLLFLLLLTALFKILTGIPIVLDNGIWWLPVLFFLPILNIILIYGVAKFKGKYYKPVAILTILGFLRSLKGIDAMDMYLLIDLLIAGFMVFLGFFLKSKFAGDYETTREYYINDMGENRGRDVISFRD